MSGAVTQIAAGVAAGDEVFGLTGFDRDGAAAEYVTVLAGELAAKTRPISHAETATLPLAALTAWQALTDYAAVEPGERVLVHGGADGVGVFAHQLAAILGAHVTRPAAARTPLSCGAWARRPSSPPGPDGRRLRHRHRHRGRPGPRRLLPAAAPGWQARHA